MDDRPSTHVVRCIARPDLIRRGGGGVRCFSEVVASKVAENGRNFTVIWFSLVLLVLTKRVFAADFGRVTEFMWMVVARCALVVRCVEPRTGRCGNICASAVFFGDCISAGDSNTLIYMYVMGRSTTGLDFHKFPPAQVWGRCAHFSHYTFACQSCIRMKDKSITNILRAYSIMYAIF